MKMLAVNRRARNNRWTSSTAGAIEAATTQGPLGLATDRYNVLTSVPQRGQGPETSGLRYEGDICE